MQRTGYFGVVVPKDGFYQGFFLMASLEAAAQRVMIEAKSAFLSDVNVLETLKEFPDNPLIGALSAALVDGTLKGEPYVAVLGQAISLLISTPYFWVEGDKCNDGILTKVGLMEDVSTIRDAQTFFRNIPEVKALVERLQRH